MDIKGVAIAIGFICIGCISLLIYGFIHEVSYTYLLLAYALIFLLGGVNIFAKLVTHAYPVEKTDFREGCVLLKQNLYFYLLEILKVLLPLFLTYFYPLEAFLLWVMLDVFDGFSLPYQKRAITLRHQIDKATDLLCMIPFFLFTISRWPELVIYFTLFFLLILIKTIGYVSTGNRDVLIYIPSTFIFIYMAFLFLLYFSPSVLDAIIGDLFALNILVAIAFVGSALYEIIYNGVLIHLRYHRRKF
ncbi:MAG: hypothetical protein ACTSRC_18730 [Candidatus Helarchaeota archaeon]